jgi:hypothetical protein
MCQIFAFGAANFHAWQLPELEAFQLQGVGTSHHHAARRGKPVDMTFAAGEQAGEDLPPRASSKR